MRAKTFVTGLLATLALWLSPSIAGAQSDSDVFSLVDALQPIATSIVVDGDDADWGAFRDTSISRATCRLIHPSRSSLPPSHRSSRRSWSGSKRQRLPPLA
jgi:hypothetical protein